MNSFPVFNRLDLLEQFREALIRRGILPPPEIITDGRIHRCHAEGKGGQGDAAYLLHLDSFPAGGFQNWRDGLGWEHWRADLKCPLSPTEEQKHQQRVGTLRQAREAFQAQRRENTREKAVSLWRRASPVDTHPYLTRKGIKAFGLRQYKSCLVIPLRDTKGAIYSLQFISAEGEKRFLKGGAITGHYHPIGHYHGVLCLCEGYATGATVHQATGHAIAVAFSESNLKPVAIRLRKKFPEARLIVCADNDRFTPGNPGVTKAREAARAVEGCLIVPRFDDLGPYDYYVEEDVHD
jgi:putative DNA primase/helicase